MNFSIRLALFALFTLLLSLANRAEACTCFGPRPPCEAFGSASAVFVGVVKSASTVSTEVDAGDRKFTIGQKLFRFSVEESFKGVSDSEVEIITGSGDGDCGYDFRTGRSLKGFWAESDEEGRYEFRRVQPGRYVIGVKLTSPPNAKTPYLRFCYPGVNDPSQAMIISIGEGTKIAGIDLRLPQSLAPQEIKGFVFWSDGRPASGARVSLDLEDYPGRLKMSHSVETDIEGKFTIIGLKGLKYSVQAVFYEDQPQYKSYDSVPLDIIPNENMPPIKLIILKPSPDADDKTMQKKKP